MGIAGGEAVLYYYRDWEPVDGLPPVLAAAWVKVPRAVDIAWSSSKEQGFDVTPRGNTWLRSGGGRKASGISFGYRKTYSGDQVYKELQEYYTKGTATWYMLLDRAKELSMPVQGWIIPAEVEMFDETWPLEDGALTDITIRPVVLKDDQNQVLDPTPVEELNP